MYALARHAILVNNEGSFGHSPDVIEELFPGLNLRRMDEARIPGECIETNGDL